MSSFFDEDASDLRSVWPPQKLLSNVRERDLLAIKTPSSLYLKTDLNLIEYINNGIITAEASSEQSIRLPPNRKRKRFKPFLY
jgi:hypothetical protein